MKPRQIPVEVEVDDVADLEVTDNRELAARVLRDNPQARA